MSQTVSLRLLASLSCSRGTRGIRSKQVRRALLRTGALHETPEPEEAEDGLLGGQQQRVRWVWNIFCVINQGSAQSTLGACQKDTEASVKALPLVKSQWYSCLPQAYWFLSMFGQWEAEFGQTVKVSPQRLLPYSLLKPPAVGVSPLLLRPPLGPCGSPFAQWPWLLGSDIIISPMASQPYVR